MKSITRILFVLLVTTFSLPVMAQGMGGMGRGMGQGAGKGPDEKKMVIKRADDGTSSEGDTVEKGDDFLKKPPSYQMFSLNGYMRLRTDWMYRLNLGHHGSDNIGTPFTPPLSAYSSGCGQIGESARCNNHTVTSTNMRLRLDPVLRPSDTVSIFSTIDIFDNFVLGSSPSGLSMGYGSATNMPYAGFDGNTSVLQNGTSSSWDTIRVKNLWGKINLKLFDLEFGRMPNHFGMGMVHNDGSGFDADYGDSVDRVRLTSLIPSWNIKVGLSWDFASQGLTTMALYPGLDQGQPRDFDDFDDNTQITMFLLQKHTDKESKRLLSNGKSVFNWGAHVSVSQQKYSMAVPQEGDSTLSFSSDNDPAILADTLESRDTKMMVPDFWLSFALGNFKIEAEIAGKYGWISNLRDVNLDKPGNDLNYLSIGGVLKTSYRWSSEVTWQLEFGYASGDDQYENIEKRGSTHYTQIPSFPVNGNDSYNNLFLFHPSYHVDMIFFREIMGTVYNSSYSKFSFLYSQSQWRFNVHGIMPFANEPVATPGNSRIYGVELDADFSYVSLDKSFVIGLAYGLFYPLDAMDRPETIYGTNSSAASMAHTVQGRILIRF
jgi:uncharacterized protein (TIGR04551 family)